MVDHTPTPWAYRPNKHDDWGWIRGPVMGGEETGELVAIARCWTTQADMDAHRQAKTDPYEPNAAYIVKACNAFPDLVKALEQIAAIENKEFGPDWEEIEEARKIAHDVLGRVKGAPDHG
jgi:hypothetical protein